MRSDLIAEIDLARLAHNLSVLRRGVRPGMPICAALKADAYGHGAAIVAPALHALGVEMAATATPGEAVELRAVGWSRPILVFGNVVAVSDAAERRARIEAAIDHRLTLTLVDDLRLDELAAAAAARRTTIDVHLKIDTGLGRQGAMPPDVPGLLDRLAAQSSVRLAGVYTHFGSADLTDRDFAARQLAAFTGLLEQCAPRLAPGVLRHAANTAATLEWPDAHLDLVRPGIGFYGYPPSDAFGRRHDLRPALRLVSHLSHVKLLPPGHCVGYGQTFTTRRPTRLGIIPAGYADGLLRALSNRGVVGCRGGDAPIIGRISMDQLAVDLTDLPHVSTGDPVVLIDERPERPNSVESLARLLGTIPYEIVCLLGERIDRVGVQRFDA